MCIPSFAVPAKTHIRIREHCYTSSGTMFNKSKPIFFETDHFKSPWSRTTAPEPAHNEPKILSMDMEPWSSY